MLFREAQLADIPQIQVVRHSVKENTLSDPSLVPDSNVADWITRRGKGWVCEIDGTIVGFAIADLQDHNIWALFVDPAFEGKGIGGKLHQLTLDWYFAQTRQTVWLDTAFNTRAETFYRMKGWRPAGTHGSKEIKFEMSWQDWQLLKV